MKFWLEMPKKTLINFDLFIYQNVEIFPCHIFIAGVGEAGVQLDTHFLVG
jgi:hypothetical protein